MRCRCHYSTVATCSFVLSCLVMSCLVLSCLVMSCLVLSCLVLSCLVLSCLVLSCLVLSCLVLSCLVLSCLVSSFPARPCLALPCLALPCLVLSPNAQRGAALLLYEQDAVEELATDPPPVIERVRSFLRDLKDLDPAIASLHHRRIQPGRLFSLLGTMSKASS